jgi:hypothetical protein
LIAEDLQNLKDREHSVSKVVQNVMKYEVKKVTEVDKFQHMFSDGKVSGQLEMIYSGFNVKNDVDPYATTLGGHLLYELADYNGFNAGVEFTTAHNINFASGDNDDGKLDPELASADGSYTEATQAFLNYKYDGLNVKVGRQLVDTPLADSDDRRIVYNTFEAAVMTYEQNDFSFMLGFLDRWQGVDVGLDVNNPWQDVGDDGVYFTGLSYSVDLFDASVWYYDMSEDKAGTSAIGNVANKSIYADISFHMLLSQDYALHTSVQYLNQNEEKNSGIEASVYGAMVEFVIKKDLVFSVAYNQSEKHSGKEVFSGYGGGTLYTNMDKTLLTDISADRDARAVVVGVTYGIENFNFLYAYGDFDGDADSSGQKEYIVEQNIGIEYNPNDNFTIGAIVNISDDKEDTGSAAYFNNGDYENYRLVATYSF